MLKIHLFKEHCTLFQLSLAQHKHPIFLDSVFPAHVRLWLFQGIGASTAHPCLPSQDQGQQQVFPKPVPSDFQCFLPPVGQRRQVLVCAQTLSPSGFRTRPEPTASEPGLQNQLRHSFIITKPYFALTVTRICSLCAVWCNAGCHSLSLAFSDVVLPNVSELCRLCKLTDHSAQNCSFQRKPPRTEMQNCFQY